jgi:hypothetical protein
MNTRRFYWLLVLSVAACSSSKAGPGSGNDPLATQSGFCESWAEAACNDDVVAACGSTTEKCVATQQDFCLDLLPLSGYSSKYVKECLDAVKDAYSDTKLTSDELKVVLHLEAPCDRLIKGSSAEGETCTEHVDCDTLSDMTCVIKAGDDTGTCQVPVPVEGGRACDDPQNVCSEGFYCDGLHCVESLDEGSVCANDDECAAELRCLTSGGTDGGASNGTCELRTDVGGQCSADEDCQSAICAVAGGTTTGICVAMLQLAPNEGLCQYLR